MIFFLQHFFTLVLADVIIVSACVFFPFILDVRLVDISAGVAQKEDHKGLLIRLPSAVLALIYLAIRIQLSSSTVKSNFVY